MNLLFDSFGHHPQWMFLHHVWKPVAVENYSVEVDLELSTFEENRTVVLYRCDGCDKVKSRWVKGKWTLAEVKGGRP